jgi:hypothetical protein
MFTKRFAWLWTLLLLLMVTDTAFACRYSGLSPIVIGGYMARGYGNVSLIISLGIIYLQVRRVGLTTATYCWVAAFIPIYFLNPGWHYNGLSGDCGFGETGDAYQMMFYLGAMLLWQIGACGRLILNTAFTKRDLNQADGRTEEKKTNGCCRDFPGFWVGTPC